MKPSLLLDNSLFVSSHVSKAMEQNPPEIINNIKHEPERHFLVILPDDPDPVPEVRDLVVNLHNFDASWSKSPKMFDSYYYCQKCHFPSRQIGDLKDHLRACKGKKTYKCVFCDTQLSCDFCKKRHVERVHLRGSWWHCIKCPYKTIYRTNLSQHYQIHEMKLSCETCKKKFSRSFNLKEHQMNKRHGVYAMKEAIRFECERCFSSFTSRYILTQHMRIIHSEVKYVCDICGRVFPCKEYISRHIKKYVKIPCHVCQRMLAPHRMREHLENHSSTVFKCKICNKKLLNSKSLRLHMRLVHKVDKLQCDYCNKIFRNKIRLRCHLQIHVKIPCSVCHKLFTRSSMERHKKSFHSAENFVYTCKIFSCRSKFSSNKELKEHEEIHIAKGRYKCPKCNFEAKHLSWLKKHLKVKLNCNRNGKS